MGKTVSATDLLQAGRPKRLATKPLVDESPRRLDVEVTKHQVAETLSPPDAQTTSGLDAQTTSNRNKSATSPLVAPAQTSTYQRATVFLTPDQRRWLKDTTKALPVEGLSASDVVRLALNELRRQVGEGAVDLVPALVKQAHLEATTMAGRRNRGLPPTG